MPTLLVIDAQKDRFDALHSSKRRRVLRNIQDEVTIAMINGDGIVFTEWEGLSPHSSLLRLIRGYSRAARFAKQGEDGAHGVVEVITSRRFAKRHIRVCGLYTSSSIAKTVSTLSTEWRKRSIIEIAAGACADSQLHGDYKFGWIRYLENVVVSDSGRAANASRRRRRMRRYNELF